jgi:hypothetical protein
LNILIDRFSRTTEVRKWMEMNKGEVVRRIERKKGER